MKTYLDDRIADSGYIPAAFLFPSRIGRDRLITKGQAWRIIKGATEACGDGRRIGTHSLRKSFARDVFNATGHNLVITQRALGHASVQTTISYVAPDQESVTRAILGTHVA